MSLRRRIKKQQDDSGVNVTPMLDIVFIMLIFFIVTATFLDVKGLDFTIPDNGVDGPETPNIQIYVDAGNQVMVDGNPTDLANVPYAVESQLAFKPNASVTLSAHYGADLDPVVRIKDKMMLAGRKTVFKIVKGSVNTP